VPNNQNIIAPKSGLAGLGENWKFDIVSGFIIFLIALPLCLGIAMASNAPPMAGIITGIIGGVICGFISGSHITINGPAAGLIVIVLGAIADLGYEGALAVGLICGVLQIILGFLRAGKMTNFFPLSVVHGMLAGIGVIIMAKQIHVALGDYSSKGSMLDTITAIPSSIANMPVDVAIIGGLCMSIMIIWPFLKLGFLQKIPAPLVAVILAVFLGQSFGLADNDLLKPLLPASIMDGFAFPDFAILGVFPGTALKWVIMYTFVASLESLLTASAVDKLDPWKRQSNMDKEFIGKGIANSLSSLLGGLPMIAEVVRSAANIQNGARTIWSNFFHGLFLLICVAFFTQYLAMIPKAALAGILVIIGFRLAHPKEFIHALHIGKEEFLFMAVTTAIVVLQDLLMGVFVGMLVALLVNIVRTGFAMGSLFKSSIEVEEKGNKTNVRFRSSLGFGNFISVRGKLDQIDAGRNIVLDFSQCRYVDHTVVERLHDFIVEYERTGGSVEQVTTMRGATNHAMSAWVK
jgi:MFS superfamily sulfate permease-like transporter